MKRTTWLSPILFAVALTPTLLQTVSCERGDTFLLDLQFVVGGEDLIQGFNINNRAYSVSTSGTTVTVNADARMDDSNVTYQWIVDGTSIEAGTIGLGGGTVVLAIPQGQSQLRVSVRAVEGVVDGYTVDVDQQEPPALVMEQATKQVGSSLVCSNLVLLPNESYSFELSPLVIDSDGNNQVSLSGQLRIAATGCSGFLIPSVRIESAEVIVSVAGASTTTVTALVAGLPATLPDTGSNCEGVFDIVLPVPAELVVSDSVVDFVPTDIAVSISRGSFGDADADVDNSRCDLVPDAQLPSIASFSAQPAGPCDFDPCNDGSSCTVDTCTVDSVNNSPICENSPVADGTVCDDLAPAAGTCRSGFCSVTRGVSVVCDDNDVFLPDLWTFPYSLTVAPRGPVQDGVPVDIELSGTATIGASFLTFVVDAFPTTSELELTAQGAMVSVRSGATGPDVPLVFEGTLPATIPLPPVIEDPATCFPFQRCVLESVSVPLTPQVATFTPTGGPAGEILFGWDESRLPPTGATYDGNPGSIGSEVEVASLQQAFECQMGRGVAPDPFNQPLVVEAVPLEDVMLLSLPISDGAVCNNGIVERPEECDDGNLSDGDGCATDCTVEPIARPLPAACSNNSNFRVLQHNMGLRVDPLSPIYPNTSFSVEIAAEAVILELWLDAVQNLLPGGVSYVVIDDVSHFVTARSGASGPPALLTNRQPYERGTCTNRPEFISPGTCRRDDQCSSGPCREFFSVPTSNNSTFCASIGKSIQWNDNGFCVTGDLRIPIESPSASFVADSAGDVLLGWREGTPPTPPQFPSQSWIVDLTTLESECYMGTANADETALIPLPDSQLIRFPIVTPAP